MDFIKVNKDDRLNYPQRNWVKMINSLTGFKSLNLLGTTDKNNNFNLCVVSSCVHLGANPALIGLILRPHSEASPRHSLLNIRETKVFTLNHINKDIYKKAHQTSARYPREVSEFEACELTPEVLNDFRAPFVKESKLKLSLNLEQIIDIKANGTYLVIGQIQDFYIPNGSMQKDGYIDIEGAGSLCGSSLDGYHETQIINRLSYAKTNKTVEEI